MAAGWERQRALFWEATRPVSERMVDLLGPRGAETILDLAAGPGDTGFLAATRLGPAGRLISTDAAPEMVEAARRHAAVLGITNVEFRVVDAAAIDLPNDSVDGVLCRYGVMLVPDCAAAAREMARVLRPSGRAAIAVWADPDRNEWMTAAGRAALEHGLIERPAPDAPGPFRLAEPQRLAELLAGAGLEVARVEEVAITWRASSLDEWWAATLDTSRMLSQAVASASAEQIEAIQAGAAERLAHYVADDGSLAVPGLARVVLARHPA